MPPSDPALPLMRVGTLIKTPMNTLLGYDAIRADEVKLVNVNFSPPAP